MKSDIISDEILEIILRECGHLNPSIEVIEEAYVEADNQGYIDGSGWSSTPDSFLSFINGYIIAKSIIG
jgi:hypothetical protein